MHTSILIFERWFLVFSFYVIFFSYRYPYDIRRHQTVIAGINRYNYDLTTTFRTFSTAFTLDRALFCICAPLRLSLSYESTKQSY